MTHPEDRAAASNHEDTAPAIPLVSWSSSLQYSISLLIGMETDRIERDLLICVGTVQSLSFPCFGYKKPSQVIDFHLL